VIERALALLPHVDFTNAYGLTETSSTIALLGSRRAPRGRRQRGSARAAPARLGGPAAARRRDPDPRPEGKPLPPGERGEICVRGEQVSGEYLGAASRLDADGWFPPATGAGSTRRATCSSRAASTT
jgi:acyl-CoA synthetase (AMP-forming)/AMP-acid ligase II